MLWPDKDNKFFYLFGGEYATREAAQGNDNQGIDLWKYDTIYNNWTEVEPDNTQNKIRWPAFGAGAVHDEGWGYYYGGYLTEKSTSSWTGPPLMLNTLIKFDMNTRVWRNSTRSDDLTPRAEGTLHYIPAANRGMLVYFGGRETSQTTGEVTYVCPTHLCRLHTLI